MAESAEGPIARIVKVTKLTVEIPRPAVAHTAASAMDRPMPKQGPQGSVSEGSPSTFADTWEVLEKMANVFDPGFDGKTIEVRRGAEPGTSGSSLGSVSEGSTSTFAHKALEKMANVIDPGFDGESPAETLQKIANIFDPHFDGETFEVEGLEEDSQMHPSP